MRAAAARTTFGPFLRRCAIAAAAVMTVSVVTVIVGDALEQHAFDHTPRIQIPRRLLTTVAPGQPANYLLIGSDTRAFGESPQDEAAFGSARSQPGNRSDVMMVLHLEPATHTAFLVSFPRDLVVAIPGHGTSLLTDAYDFGGAALTIETVETDFAPLRINHYIEVDFKGFRDIVRAVGHIPIWFPTPVRDDNTGLDEPAGCQSLDGDEALAYARSRHYDIPEDPQHPAAWRPRGDDKRSPGWIQDPLEDLDRIPRQQYFLRTLSTSVLAQTAGNPTKLLGLLDAVEPNFGHDQTLRLSELKSLLRTFVGLDPKRLDMSTLPVVGIASGRWEGHVLADQPQAALVLARLSTFSGRAPSAPSSPAPSTGSAPAVTQARGAATVAPVTFDRQFVPVDPVTHGPLTGCPG